MLPCSKSVQLASDSTRPILLRRSPNTGLLQTVCPRLCKRPARTAPKKGARFKQRVAIGRLSSKTIRRLSCSDPPFAALSFAPHCGELPLFADRLWHMVHNHPVPVVALTTSCPPLHMAMANFLPSGAFLLLPSLPFFASPFALCAASAFHRDASDL